MNIWKVSHWKPLTDPLNTMRVEWYALKRDAEVRQLKLIEKITANVRVEQITIPEQRAGLVEWLNRNFTRDNR